MIVISGALVLVALVLLIIGVVGPELTFVYASIAVSLVSLVFLVIGILQRRGETAPAPEAAPAEGTTSSSDEASSDDAEGVTAVIPAQEGRGSRKVAEAAPIADTADEELEVGGTVLVVEGRPRYHVDGCRYLSGKEVEEVDVFDARDEGFTPCGVCKPDDVLEQEEAELLAQEQAADDVADADVADDEPVEQEPVVEEDVPGVEVPPARAKAPAKKTAAKKAPSKAAKAPAKAVKAPTRAVGATSTKAPSRSAVKAAAAASPAAAAAASKPGSVVVIPDRGKFHRAECRYVRDVDDAEVLSKSAASRQGYAACGVCKP